MASLANQTISSSYDGLIKTSSDNAVGVSGVQLLQDGSGNDLALSVGRSGQGASITGNLTVDTNTLFVDAANNRVGINKTPSSESLEVSGNINTTGSLTAGTALICTNGPLVVDSGATSQYGVFDTDAANGGYMSFLKAGTTLADIGNAGQIVSGGSANDFGINVRPSNNLIFGTDNQERMRIDSSGNVLVNTTTALSPSTNRGNITISGSDSAILNVAYNDTASGYMYCDSSGTEIGEKRNAFFKIHTNGTERMRIDSSGNVGIGASDITSVGNYKVLELNGSSTNGGYLRLASSDVEQGYVASNSGGILIVSNGATNQSFYTNGTERMRIDASGNVQMGTGAANSNNYSFKISAGTSGLSRIIASDTSDSGYIDYDHSSDSWIHRTSGTERMRITSGGEVLFNLNSSIRTNALLQAQSKTGAAATQPTVLLKHQSSTGATYGRTVEFFNSSNGEVGSIESNGTTTRYNTSSDYRLKENVVPISGALERVDALKPSRFNFISVPELEIDGFIAHELAEVVPEAVSGEKDAVDEEGNPIYQGIDQSKIVPLLVGAIKELSAKVAALESQLNS